MEWNNELFFFVLLPLIIFATGYNMRRKNFFKNMANVAKFGLLGTTLTFVFYAFFMTIVMNYIPLKKYNPLTDSYKEWKLDFPSTLYLCAVLSSSDIIAAVTLINEKE